jgi:hypothetical protein
MRAAAFIVGVGMALVGLLMAQDQFLLWQQDGFYTPMRFAALWIALWGTPSDPMWLYNAPPLEAWLMAQPLSTVLPMVGACLAWFGMDGLGRRSLRV